MSSPLTINSVSRSLDPNEAKGPLAALAKNAFSTTDLRYPINLGTNNFEGLHYITFYVNVQEKSKYNVSERTQIGSVANQNRANDYAKGFEQISGTTDAIGVVGPSFISDICASEMNNRIDSFKRSKIDISRTWIPRNFIRRDDGPSY